VAQGEGLEFKPQCSKKKKKKKKKNLYSSIKPGNFLPFYLSLTTREVNLSVKTYSFRDMVLDLEN
jgi:hypothetical protein